MKCTLRYVSFAQYIFTRVASAVFILAIEHDFDVSMYTMMWNASRIKVRWFDIIVDAEPQFRHQGIECRAMFLS